LTLLSANVEVQIGFCVIAENAEVAALIGGFAAADVLIDLDTAAAVLVAVSIVPEDAEMIVLVAAAAALVAVSIALEIAFEHPAPFEPLLHHLKTWFR
jgi:hypothetical protein